MKTYTARQSILALLLPLASMTMIIGIFLPNTYKAIVAFFTTKLVISKQKIHGRTGLIKIQQMDSPLGKVQNINLKQSFFGQLLNYGTLEITTSSGIYHFQGISNPKAFRDAYFKIEEYVEQEKIRNSAHIHAEAMSGVTLNTNSNT